MINTFYNTLMTFLTWNDPCDLLHDANSSCTMNTSWSWNLQPFLNPQTFKYSHTNISDHRVIFTLTNRGRKLGCVVKMVVDSLLPHAECGPNNHRKDASRLKSPVLDRYDFEKWKLPYVYANTIVHVVTIKWRIWHSLPWSRMNRRIFIL